MKKIKIYFHEDKLKPIGGPAGYLWNLKQGLNNLDCSDLSISFLPQAEETIEDNKMLRRVLPNRIKDIRRAWKFANYLKRKNATDYELHNYDVVHFHNTEDLYFNRDVLENYEGKVILTSHTPCAPYKEIVSRLNPKDYRVFKKRIDQLEIMDQYAFERADYIIFPCKEAEEPYYHTWNKYADIRVADKYRYMATGIAGCTAKIDRTEFRKRYGIPQDAFVVSYVGRHNEIKGYGDLKVIGEQLLKNENVYFLVAGAEEPMKGLEHQRWVEIGWTDDPHSVIAASDVFVLPNRETYFDLILLEVISLGIPMVLSSTGGNKYFQKYGLRGMKFYSSTRDAVERIKEYQVMEKQERMEVGLELKELFLNDFSVTVFAKNYVDILREILD